MVGEHNVASYDVASKLCQALFAEDSAKNHEGYLTRVKEGAVEDRSTRGGSNTRRNSLGKSSGHSSRDAADLNLLRGEGEWGRVSCEAVELEEGAVTRLARASYEAEGVKEGAVARRGSLDLAPETPPPPTAPADMSVDQMMDEVMQAPPTPCGAGPGLETRI